jgi:hypothetical protein
MHRPRTCRIVTDTNPPNFRYVTIDARMGVYNLTPRTLPDEALSTC